MKIKISLIIDDRFVDEYLNNKTKFIFKSFKCEVPRIKFTRISFKWKCFFLNKIRLRNNKLEWWKRMKSSKGLKQTTSETVIIRMKMKRESFTNKC